MRIAITFLALAILSAQSRADPATPCIDSIDRLASSTYSSPRDMFERLSCLDTLTDAEVEAMLGSDDPRLIGIGIQAADRRRRLDLLTAHPEFAVDMRETVPVEVMSSNPMLPYSFPMKQSVADLYRGMMDAWFGVWPLTTQEVLDVVPEGADPWEHARPWAVNIHRTSLRNDPAQMKAIFDDLRTRSAELRVFVIGWTFSMSAFASAMSVEQAREVLSDISAASLQSMRTLEENLPPDPALENAEFRSSLLDTVEYIIAADR